eukprot:5297674-Ditylum_brightwellii.AAC.1
MVWAYVKSNSDQYVLVATLCRGLKKIWHHVDAAENNFKERNSSTFDAMPAVWKKLQPET